MKRAASMVAVFLTVFVLTAPAQAVDFSSWQRKAQITFTGYNPPGGATTLTNFPALVVLSTNISGFDYSDFQSLTNQDLRFTASDLRSGRVGCLRTEPHRFLVPHGPDECEHHEPADLLRRGYRPDRGPHGRDDAAVQFRPQL